MPMYVDMDFNLIQVLMFVVYQYMYIKLIAFAIVSCLHCFVHRIDLSLMLTLTILIIQTGCFSNIIKSLLAVFTYKKISRNAEEQGNQLFWNSKQPEIIFSKASTNFLLTIRARVFTWEYWPKVAAVQKCHSANISQYSSRKQGNGHALMSLRLMRSEERRVGKECRSRWSPYH